MLVERVPRSRVHREDEAAVRAVERLDDRPQAGRLGVRLPMDRQHRVGLCVRGCPAPRNGLEETRCIAHHVAHHLAPARARPPARAAMRSARRDRRGGPTAGRPRCGSALLASTGRSSGGRPRRARSAPPRRRRAPPPGSSSCRRRRAPSRAALPRSPRGSAGSSPAGRRCAGRACGPAPGCRARRRRPATSRGPSAGPCAARPRRSPPSRERHRERRRLDELGPVPDHGEDFRHPRYDTRRFPGR